MYGIDSLCFVSCIIDISAEFFVDRRLEIKSACAIAFFILRSVGPEFYHQFVCGQIFDIRAVIIPLVVVHGFYRRVHDHGGRRHLSRSRLLGRASINTFPVFLEIAKVYCRLECISEVVLQRCADIQHFCIVPVSYINNSGLTVLIICWYWLIVVRI